MSRRASKLEPIKLDDLLSSSSLEGLVSFLDLPAKSSKTRSDSSLNLKTPTVGVLHTPTPERRGGAQSELDPPSIGVSDPPTGSAEETSEGIPTQRGNGETIQERLPRPSHLTESPTVDVLREAPRVTTHNPTVDDLNAPTVDVSKQRDTESATYVHTPTGDGLYAPTVGVNSVASRDAYSPPVGVSQTPTVKTAFREQFPTDEDRDVNEPREPSAGTSLLQFSIAAPPTLDSFAWFQSLNGKQLFDARGVRRIAVVQDILSNVEFGYYRKLWDAAGGEFRVISKDDRVKVFQAGYATLSRLLNMDRRSVAKYVVDAFEAKYVMEVAEEGRAASRTCAIYRLFSYREILDRLRAAGCVYAKKHGKTVYLVRALNQGFPSAPVGVSSPPTVGDSDPPSVQVSDTPTVAKTSTVGDTPIQSVGVSPIGSVDVSGRPSLLGFKRGNSLGEYDDVVVELEKLILESPYSQFDRYGIATIVKQSRERVPDITASEIYTLFQEKARTLAGNRKIDNFIGVLLWAWPGFFTETRVFSLREAIRKQKEEDQKRREETIAMYRQFVNDPSMPDNWREEARRFLADAENEQHKAE